MPEQANHCLLRKSIVQQPCQRAFLTISCEPRTDHRSNSYGGEPLNQLPCLVCIRTNPCQHLTSQDLVLSVLVPNLVLLLGNLHLLSEDGEEATIVFLVLMLRLARLQLFQKQSEKSQIGSYSFKST